jgi:hypothetical protein
MALPFWYGSAKLFQQTAFTDWRQTGQDEFDSTLHGGSAR